MPKLTDLIGVYDNLGEEPSLLNHPQNILAITITFMILTWITAVFRLYTRFFIICSPWWDDAFVILSLLSTSVGSINICLAVAYGGMGLHFILLGEATMARYLKVHSHRSWATAKALSNFNADGMLLQRSMSDLYVANASYPLSAGFIKLAVLFQYLRVYDKDSYFRKLTIATIIIVALWSTAYGFLGWVPCVPVYAFWDLDMPATRYGFASLYVGPFVSTYTSLVASNMVLDLMILALAAPLLLYNQDRDKRSRWTLIILFAFGSIATVFSILRLASIIDTVATTSPTFDPTWYGSTPIVYAAIEVDIATISAALPVFWPVLVDLSGRTQILVTREVKVTLEHRSDLDDDAIELQRSRSGLQARTTRSDYYDDPYIAEQVNPFKGPQFGVKADVDASHSQNQSRIQQDTRSAKFD